MNGHFSARGLWPQFMLLCSNVKKSEGVQTKELPLLLYHSTTMVLCIEITHCVATEPCTLNDYFSADAFLMKRCRLMIVDTVKVRLSGVRSTGIYIGRISPKVCSRWFSLMKWRPNRSLWWHCDDTVMNGKYEERLFARHPYLETLFC